MLIEDMKWYRFEIINRITDAIDEMTNEDLAELHNKVSDNSPIRHIKDTEDEFENIIEENPND